MGKGKIYLEWTEIPGGILKGATDRFWVALGSEAGLVAGRINLDPKFTEELAELAATLAAAGREDKDQTLEQIRQLDT